MTTAQISEDADGLAWHALSLGDVFTLTLGRESGLSSSEALDRLRMLGPNVISDRCDSGFLGFLRRNALGPLAWCALAAAALAAWSGFPVACALLLLAVVFRRSLRIGGMWCTRSLRAGRTARGRLMAKAWRDGRLLTIPSFRLVVGDVVEIEAGDEVPADGRIISSMGLQCSELALTGKPDPVPKSAEDRLDIAAPLDRRCNMVFQGSTVVEGKAEAVIVGTGPATELCHRLHSDPKAA